MRDPLFKTWLYRNPDDENLAYCKFCKRSINQKKKNLNIVQHMKTTSYINVKATSMPDEKREISTEVKKAEIKLCVAIVEHNVPFHVMNYISLVIQSAFHDSETAKFRSGIKEQNL